MQQRDIKRSSLKIFFKIGRLWCRFFCLARKRRHNHCVASDDISRRTILKNRSVHKVHEDFEKSCNKEISSAVAIHLFRHGRVNERSNPIHIKRPRLHPGRKLLKTHHKLTDDWSRGINNVSVFSKP